jgi:DNA topoisomerase-1
VDETHKARIRSLAIPPAWRDVWICPWPNGHIQAVGVDDAGRRQYLYHEEWRRQRDREKFDRVLQLAPLLPSMRQRIDADLCGRRLNRDRVLAVALRMVDHGGFRTGGEEYAEAHGTHGAATLNCAHVRVRGEQIHFDYRAKAGVERTFAVRDASLATAIRALCRVRPDTERLLAYREGRGWRELHSDDVNERFKNLVGEEFSVKDLRTWHATVLAATALADRARPTSKRAARRAEAEVMREVSEHLGNTPAVARKSYVDPRLTDHFEHGVTIRDTLDGVDLGDLSGPETRAEIERAVRELLTTHS